MDPFLKAHIKTTLKRLNIHVRPIRPQRSSMAEFTWHLARRGLEVGTIIDVGVADGTLELYRNFPDANLLLVEPVEEFRPAIEAILRRYKGQVCFAAAGDQPGIVNLAIGNGLADAHNAHARGAGGRGSRPVPVRRVDSLVAELRMPGPYLLKVDVEGCEPAVVRGAVGILPETEVVILETGFDDSDGREMAFRDVVNLMGDLGYEVYDMFSGWIREGDGVLVGCDTAFVKRDGYLKGIPPRHAGRTAMTRTIENVRRFIGA
jgi:FkbM family methyltransferase